MAKPSRGYSAVSLSSSWKQGQYTTLGVSFVNLTQSRITWAGSHNEDLSRLSRLWACLWGIFLTELTEVGRAILNGAGSGLREKETWTEYQHAPVFTVDAVWLTASSACHWETITLSRDLSPFRCFWQSIWSQWHERKWRTPCQSPCCQFNPSPESPGKRETQLKSFLGQTGLWPCLWGIFLVAIRCKNDQPTLDVPFRGRQAWVA